jgi:DNA-binding XRE family transcriptional regulator
MPAGDVYRVVRRAALPAHADIWHTMRLYPKNPEKLAALVRMHRQRLGKTQTDAAATYRISPCTLSGIESAQYRYISDRIADSLADLLGVDRQTFRRKFTDIPPELR